MKAMRKTKKAAKLYKVAAKRHQRAVTDAFLLPKQKYA